MTDEVEVRRIDHTATIWFAAMIVAVAIPFTGIILSGWKPTDLEGAGPDVWWIGFVFTWIGIAFISYAGCPIYWGNVRIAHKQKSLASRGGVIFFMIGVLAAGAAMLF